MVRGELVQALRRMGYKTIMLNHNLGDREHRL